MSVYSNESPILGVGTVPATVIDSWFSAVGPKFANFAPDKTYRAAPPIGASIVTYAQRWGANSDLVAGQIAHETAFWQSTYSRLRNNPSGLGAINSAPDQALTFASADEGIRATVAHLLSYVRGDGDWSQYDPRYAAVKAAGWLGVAHVLRDLEQRWAFTPTAIYNATPASQRYGAGIAALANDLVAFAQQTGGSVPDISGFTPPRVIQQWFAPNGVSYMGEDMDMWGVCAHQTGNTSPGAEAQQNATYMQSPECVQRQASWHATVGLEEVIETIPQSKQAYHASDGSGPGNTHFKAVEHVVCYPVGSPEYRRVMLNGAWYTAKSLIDAGKPATADTLKQHHDFARDGKNCPAQFRDNQQWPEYVALTQAFHAAGSTPAPTSATVDPTSNPDYFAETGKYLATEFSARWHADGIDTWGYPISGAFNEVDLLHPDAGPRLTQYFQRGVMRLFPEYTDKYRVQGDLLGVAELARRYPNNSAPA